MRVEVKCEVMKGHTTLLRYMDPWFIPSGAKILKDGTTNLYQNVQLLRKSEMIERYALSETEILSDWYLCMSFNNKSTVASDVFVTNGKKRTYAYPIRVFQMIVDGKECHPPTLDLLTTHEITIRTTNINPIREEVTVTLDALNVADQYNYTLRSAFHIRRFERQLEATGLFIDLPSDIWTEPEEYTHSLAKAIGKVFYKLVKSSGAIKYPGVMGIIHDTYKQLLNDKDDRGSLTSSSLSEPTTMSPEELLRYQKMEEEVYAAEAELRGLTVEDLKKQFSS